MDNVTTREEVIMCDVESYVGVVTMRRPPANAMNAQFFEELRQVFDGLSNRGDVRVAILTGAGRMFSAGADVKMWTPGEPTAADLREFLRLGRAALQAVVDCRVPVVAAINGAALGGGLSLVASCDVLVASENAMLGLPEIHVGLLGGGRHAMRLFPHSKARRMVLTGQMISGPELYRLGIVEECVPSGELMERAKAIAVEVAAKSPLAVRLTKRALNAVEAMSLGDGFRFEHDLNEELATSPDSREALRAFIEKRPPVFGGR